jgi:hypothetical protein
MHNKPRSTYCDVRIPTGSSEMDQSYSMDYLQYFIHAFELLSYRDNKNFKYFFMFQVWKLKKMAQSPEMLRQRAEITKRNEVRTGRQETRKVHIL